MIRIARFAIDDIESSTVLRIILSDVQDLTILKILRSLKVLSTDIELPPSEDMISSMTLIRTTKQSKILKLSLK
jgi:hypothetical protein